MDIEYVSELKKPTDTIDLYKALEWYQLSGYTDEDIEKANASFYSCYAYDGDKLVGLGRVASDGLIAAIMSGICVRTDYRASLTTARQGFTSSAFRYSARTALSSGMREWALRKCPWECASQCPCAKNAAL